MMYSKFRWTNSEEMLVKFNLLLSQENFCQEESKKANLLSFSLVQHETPSLGPSCLLDRHHLLADNNNNNVTKHEGFRF